MFTRYGSFVVIISCISVALQSLALSVFSRKLMWFSCFQPFKFTHSPLSSCFRISNCCVSLQVDIHNTMRFLANKATDFGKTHLYQSKIDNHPKQNHVCSLLWIYVSNKCGIEWYWGLFSRFSPTPNVYLWERSCFDVEHTNEAEKLEGLTCSWPQKPTYITVFEKSATAPSRCFLCDLIEWLYATNLVTVIEKQCISHAVQEKLPKKLQKNMMSRV